MTHSKNYSLSFEREAILLSVKPKFTELIIAGSKRVEFRRTIPKRDIKTIAIYASSPLKAIVALADVIETVEAKPSQLWKLAKINGGGLTKAEFQTYFELKVTGFAFLLENVRVFDKPVNPRKIFKEFTPPQSFKYLSLKEIQKLKSLLNKQDKK